jgi:hypothetical protein
MSDGDVIGHYLSIRRRRPQQSASGRTVARCDQRRCVAPCSERLVENNGYPTILVQDA